MAGCTNARLLREGPFEEIWVQPAAGDSGTALGAAMHVAHELGDDVQPTGSAALGRGWDDDELAGWLKRADVRYERPADVADVDVAVATGFRRPDELAADGVTRRSCV
ncbi:MAG: carbamoyltransferase N-terminal domain-containing protein [Solirubrobacteraceae bacterium]